MHVSLYRRMRTALLRAFLVVALLIGKQAMASTITFENLADGTSLDNQYSGLAFANAVVLTAGVSLNEVDFPPHSGSNVITDNGGPILISFVSGQSSLSFYVTYLQPLTVSAYDANNNLLTTTHTLFDTNDISGGSPGSSPNELLSLSGSTPFSRLVIAGSPSGGSFTLDDLTFGNGPNSPVPEPNTLTMLFTAFVVLGSLQLHRCVRTVKAR